MFEPLRRAIAKMIAPKAKAATRMYAGARASRLTGGFGSYGNTSADAELSTSLTQLRSRSRQLVRDAPYAKRAKVIVVNNVIGTGVGLQGQVKTSRDGALFARINDDIEEEFCEWACADSCHTGGALHFADLERAIMSEVFTAGEAIVRMHPRAFGKSDVPFALELIEAERLADDSSSIAPTSPDVYVKMGVELDSFDRAVAYWIRERHPGDLKQPNGYPRTRFVRVPAEEIIHVRLVDRWPQTRGEPWLHSVLRKLNDMEEYSGSELLAARMSANYFATIKSPEMEPLAGREAGRRHEAVEHRAGHDRPTVARRRARLSRAEPPEHGARPVHALHAARGRGRHRRLVRVAVARLLAEQLFELAARAARRPRSVARAAGLVGAQFPRCACIRHG
jgi:lambda family phage portal protein